jgi:hypothetical protein
MMESKNAGTLPDERAQAINTTVAVLQVCGEIDVQPPPGRVGKNLVHLDLRRIAERAFAPSVERGFGVITVG